MPQLELSFASGETSLSVRRFAVREGLSSLFSVSVWARSKNDDLDLESIVGQAAAFQVASGMAFSLFGGSRRWSGICHEMGHVETESTGLSMYRFRIAPSLWLLTQRTNCRLFQHSSIPDIIARMLDEWQITPEWRIDRAAYPKLELRIQYGESDFAFFSRLLEEAGISYLFSDDGESRLLLSDAPQSVEPRPGLPIPFQDNANQAAEQEYVSKVCVVRDVRPGRVTLRDHDFRRQPKYPLLGSSGTALASIEDRLEVYQFRPGAALVELESSAALKIDRATGVGIAHKLLDVALGEQSLGDFGRDAGVMAVGRLDQEAQKHLHGFAGKAEHEAAGLLQAGIQGGLKGAVQKAEQDIDGLVQKAESFVEGKVGGLVADKLGGLAGGVVGDILGDLSGDIAGNIAAAIAGKMASAVKSGLDRLASDDKGFSRHDDKAAMRLSQTHLESLRATSFCISFSTNAIDLTPGTTFSMRNHPRTGLGPKDKLLVTSFMLEGTPDGDWDMNAQAVFANRPYRPAMATSKPVVHGVQSALVVGPPGQEIYTDEHGRVRVQFHWDRENQHDDNSSCWMRVSQGWAGAGYGMITTPRVGHEVLVSFTHGDPDLPMVSGSAFSTTSPVPHQLPALKTRSSWRSKSSPGGDGANEIMMEDAKGKELVYHQAERDMQIVVKNSRGAVVGQVDSALIGKKYSAHISQPALPPPTILPTGIEMVDRKITLTTGEASITLEKDTLTIRAKKLITIESEGDDIRIQGGPNVKINCGPEEKKEEKKKPSGKPAKPTPAEVQKMIDDANALQAAGKLPEAAALKQRAIDKAIKCYGIDISKTTGVKYDSTVSGEGETNGAGAVGIGDAAFTTAGWLGSTIGHEAEVHAGQQAAENKWYLGKQGTAMQEVQAYDYELKNAPRYGLSQDEIGDTIRRRDDYYNDLSDANKASVDGDPASYDLPKGQEKS